VQFRLAKPCSRSRGVSLLTVVWPGAGVISRMSQVEAFGSSAVVSSALTSCPRAEPYFLQGHKNRLGSRSSAPLKGYAENRFTTDQRPTGPSACYCGSERLGGNTCLNHSAASPSFLVTSFIGRLCRIVLRSSASWPHRMLKFSLVPNASSNRSHRVLAVTMS
jgi:hypothetical protein